jgi:hypothetical protein
MSNAAGSNHPITIQQAGNVSRVQEMVQRGPEQHQAAATEESAERFQKERTQVLTSDPSSNDNRVKPDDKGKREWRWKRGKKKTKEEEAELETRAESGGLVDLVI